MRQLLGRIVHYFGLGTVTTFERTGGHSSKNFFVTTDGGEYLVKVARKDTGVGNDGIPATDYLERILAYGIRTAPFLRATDGGYAFLEGDIVATVQERLSGRAPETATPGMASAIGEELAKLHLVPFRGLSKREKNWFHPDFLPDMMALIRGRYAEAPRIPELIALYDGLDADWPALPQAILHADLYLDNTLFRGQDLVAVIDWEEVCVGAAVQDIGMAVTGWCFLDRTFDRECYDALLGGYGRVRPLSPKERSHLTAAVRHAGITRTAWRFLCGNHSRQQDYSPVHYLAFWEEGLDLWEAP